MFCDEVPALEVLDWPENPYRGFKEECRCGSNMVACAMWDRACSCTHDAIAAYAQEPHDSHWDLMNIHDIRSSGPTGCADNERRYTPMMQESKKSKCWLPLVIGLAALLAVVGVVLALVLGGMFKSLEEPVRTEAILYWNVDRDTYTENSETGLSTREPAEDGLYHMRFVSEGELLELVTPDKKLVNIIDTLPVCALQRDGVNILDVQDPLDLGYSLQKGIYIQKVEENTVVTNSSIAMNGMATRFKVSEELQILDCREKESTLGQVMEHTDLLVMDYVTVCLDASGDPTHIFLAGRTPRSSVYWRANQYYSSTEKSTTRVPNEDGVYMVDFFCDGERVTLPCKSKDVVTAIDKSGRLVCHMGLVLDENGFITGTKNSALSLKALTGCEGYTVQSVDGNSFTAQALTGKKAGESFTGTLSADCAIYDVSETAISEGRQGKAVENVQVGDRVTVWTDPDGNPVLIYITIRVTDAPAYFSAARKYTTKNGVAQTSRQPDKNGWYEIEMYKVGESTPKTYRTKDVNIVNTIDVPANRVAGLVLDGDVIVRAYKSESLYGYTPVGPRYVSAYTSSIYSAMIYKDPDSVVNGIVGPNCKVYDYSGTGKMGAETTLQEGDLIFVHRNAAEEALAIYITKRAMGEDHLYWNLGRQYDATNKVTKREPDAEGYYVFDVAHKGKQTTVKTKSKAIATAMDAMTPGAMGLTVKNGIVQYAYDPIQTSGALRVAFYSTVTAIDEDGTVHAVTTTGIESSFKPAADCKYYNTSAAHYSHKGEYTDGIRVNDLVTGYLDMYGEAKFVYIYGRDVEEIYYNTQRMYSSATKETTREPNADGYYVFELAVDGEIKTLKTKNKDVATAVDKQTSAFGLLTKGDIIYSVVGAERVKDVDAVACTGWNVIKINGKKVTLQFQKPGSKDYTGKTMEVQLHKWHRAYDVSPTAKEFGAKVSLQVGDRAQMYKADDGNILYTYIQTHNTRAAGETGYCEHCKTDVHWEPWTGAAFTAGGHFYVNCDVEKTAVLSIGDSKSEFEVVLDLNGKTITTTDARAFSVGLGESLVILDSAKGGTVAATGATTIKKESDYAGGVVNLYSNGKFTLYGGTLKHLGENTKVSQGGVVYAGAGTAFTMYGGTLTGGTVVGEKGIGGNVYSKGAAINLLGGTVTGGNATHVGGNVYTTGALTLGAVKITNGTATNLGGNVYCASALAMEGTTVTGGTASRGGNIYNTGDLVMKDCTVTGGTASVVGADLMHNAEKDTQTVTITGGQINNMTIGKATTKVTVGGKLLVYCMDLTSGAKLTLGEMDTETKIYVNAAGVFTEPSDKAADYLSCFGKARDVADDNKIALDGDVLKMAHVRLNAPLCPHCGENVEWQLWTGNGAAGHYYLNDDMTVAAAPAITDKDGVILDLNGKTYDATETRAFYVNGGYLAIVDTVGTGVVKGNNLLGAGKGSIANVIGGKFELYGGTLAPYAAISGGTAFYVSTSADGQTRSQFAIYGGTIDCSGLTGVAGEKSAVNVKGSDVLLAGGEIKAESSMYLGSNITVTVSGAPKIQLLKLTGDNKLTLGEMTQNASITVDAVGDFTVANPNAKAYLDAGYILPADPAATITEADGVLSMAVDPCPHCSQEMEDITWAPLTTKSGTVAAGHYFLENDLELEGTLTISDETEGVVIDLRGNTIECTTSRCFNVTGWLTILDTVDGGVMSGKRTGSTLNKGNIAIVNGGIFDMYGGTAVPAIAMPYGSAFYVTGGAELNLYGGTIDCSALTTANSTSGAVYVNTGSFMIMEGGTINGAAAASGGGIFVNAGTLTVTGGTITGGAANNMGGGIFAMGASVVKIGGTANISGNTAVNSGNDVLIGTGGTLELSGSPIIGELVPGTSVMFDVGVLTTGTNIGVKGAGAVTNANADLPAYLEAGYFHATVAGKVLAVEDNVLVIKDEE